MDIPKVENLYYTFFLPKFNVNKIGSSTRTAGQNQDCRSSGSLIFLSYGFSSFDGEVQKNAGERYFFFSTQSLCFTNIIFIDEKHFVAAVTDGGLFDNLGILIR